MLHAVLAALLVMVLTLAAPTNLLTAAYANTEGCDAQAAALEATHAAIDEHNARKPAPGPPAIIEPYNLEAAGLRARQSGDIAALLSCTAKILNPDNVESRPLSDEDRGKIADALNKVPPGWQPPSTPLKHQWNRNAAVPEPIRPLYEAARTLTPPRGTPLETKYQGQPGPNTGAPIPGMPGRTVGTRKNGSNRGKPDVQIDHIVPLAELLQMPGITKLSPENFYAVITAPRNFQWLAGIVNRMKGSRSAVDVVGMDSAWIARQQVLQDETRQVMAKIIEQMVKSQVN